MTRYKEQNSKFNQECEEVLSFFRHGKQIFLFPLYKSNFLSHSYLHFRARPKDDIFIIQH